MKPEYNVSFNLSRVEIHSHRGNDEREKNDKVERRIGRQQTKKKKVERIRNPGFSTRKKRKSSVHWRIPQWKLPTLQHLAEIETIRERIVHDVAGKNIIRNDEAAHRCQLPVRDEDDENQE
jgi:hypothetical protein